MCSNGDVFAQSSLELYAYLQNAYAKQPVYGKFHTSTPATNRGVLRIRISF